MSPRFEIVEAKRQHCGLMARRMRRGSLIALERAGADPHKELRECFDQSAFRKAWLIDGRLAALGGVFGTLASSAGMVWLALSEETARHPKAVVQEARRQLSSLALSKQRLSTSIFEADEPSLRLAIFLGFHVADAAFDGPAETRQGRRLLAREIASNADVRVAVGASYLIPMEYRPEAA